MSKIIAFSGTHGTGKTTAVYKRITQLKLEYPGLMIGPHVENLVFCPYPINSGSTPDTQMWVFTNHIQAELHLMTCYDIVVSDRSAVDAIAYTMAHGWHGLGLAMVDMVKHHMHNYHEIIITQALNNHLHADGMRDTDPVFRSIVEDELIKIYGMLGYYIDTNSHGELKAVRPDRHGLETAGVNP